MADAGGRERGGQIPIHAVAEADEDARRRGPPRARAGRRASAEAAACRAASIACDASAGRALNCHRAGSERADRPDPFEVVAVRRVGSRAGSGPSIVRRSPGSPPDTRAAWRPRGSGVACPPPDRRVAVCWPARAAPDRLDLQCPRPLAVRHAGRRCRGRPERQSAPGAVRRSDDDHDPGSGRDARGPPPRHEQASTREDRDPPRPIDQPMTGIAQAAAIAPTASQPLRGTSADRHQRP